MTHSKSNIYIFLASLAIVGILGGLGAFAIQAGMTLTAHASGTSYLPYCDNNGNSNATSTKNHLLIAQYLTTSSATSSVTCYTGGAKSVDVNLMAVASSSSSVVLYKVSYSLNGIDWYNQNNETNSGSVFTESAGTVYHTWTPTVLSTTTRNTVLTPVNAPYTKVEYSAAGAGVGLYLQISPKIEVSN